MKDEDIDLSDSPELTDEELARLRPNMWEKLQATKSLVRPDLLAWYRAQTPDWVERINDVLQKHRDAVTAAG